MKNSELLMPNVAERLHFAPWVNFAPADRLHLIQQRLLFKTQNKRLELVELSII